jgi:hypothetical protein
MVQEEIDRKTIIILFLFQIAKYLRSGKHMVGIMNDRGIENCFSNCRENATLNNFTDNRIKRCIQQLLK